MILSQPHVHNLPHDPSAIRAYWREFLGKKKLEPQADPRKVRAYISENRWVADCPSCGAGMSCWDQNPEACCLGCGRVFRPEWPKNREAAEAVLESRPPSARHWLPGEPVAQLEAENATSLNVEPRLQVQPEAKPRVFFTVPTSDHETLAADVLRLAKTGYVIQHDTKTGVCEVELQQHSAKDAARIEKDLNG